MNSFVSQIFVRSLGIGLEETCDQAVDEAVSDESLLQCICLNDKEAFGQLFRRYAKVARGIARRILHDDAESEDFVQDFFLYLHRKCHVYDSKKGPANSWIVQGIYYQALQRRMRLAARNHHSPPAIGESEQPAAVSSTAMDYDQSLEGRLGRAKLRQMLDSLTLDQWETLRLHFFEGYTLSEIARKREQTLGNVRHHFYRALEKLRNNVFQSELQDPVTNRITSGTR